MWLSNVPTPGTRRRKFRPGVESLEGRLAPAIFSVTSLADSNAPGSGSLRRAITDSNATAGPNTINIVTPGTYALTLNGANDDNTAGDLDILANSVTIQNQSGGRVVIDAGVLTPGDRVFDVSPTGAAIRDVEIIGVTIQGGHATGPGGAGIQVQNGSNLVLSNDVVQNNVASNADGGGLRMVGGGSLTVTRCLFANNSSTPGALGLGGGGAYVQDTANVTVTGSQFFHNSAVGNNSSAGGLLYSGPGPTLSFADTTFNANSAGSLAGGLELATTADVLLTNVTLSGNSAGNGGGLVLLSAGTNTVTARNVTVTLNAAGNGVGGVLSNATQGAVKLLNSIVAGNTVGAGATASDVDDGGTPADLVDGGNNFIGSNQNATTAFTPGTPNARGSFVGTAAAPLDPRLLPLADNGGAFPLPDGSHVPTHESLPDAGTNGVRDRGGDAGAPAADARGFPRKIDAHVDVGAFEFQDFDATVSAAPAGPLHAGLPTALTFTVTNNGPNPSRGVTLAVTLPNGTAAAGANGPLAIVVQVVPLAVPDLAPGASTTLTLTVTPAAAGPFPVSAALSGHDDPVPGNNTFAVTLAVLPRPFPATGSADVTTLVRVVLQGRRAARRVVVVVTNAGGTPIQGPLALVLDRLPRGVKVRNAGGRLAGRRPFARLDAGGDNILDPGESATAVLVFSRPFRPRRLRVLAGAFA